MAAKRNPLKLRDLAKSDQLKNMLTELEGAPKAGERESSVTWTRRFAASGKEKCVPAPRIRLE